ncbi:hypothetical protein J3Q64DRAFT_1713219 [Phycomyces blakesleeanus]|uniref:F-box domain-containing protein n=1 Tax=Phycomyces blakesleeanus TaxID=4837 RepID=A0ABR3BEW5_PHYBL
MANLPFEILTQVAIHINQPKDLRACTLVCQSWYRPFTERLWSRLCINTISQLNAVSGTFSSHKSLAPFYSRVRTLHLKCPFKIHSHRFHLIQQRFHDLEALHIHSDCLTSACFSQSTANWGLWKYLTVLEFSMGQHEISPAEFIAVLPLVPYLKQLVYAQREARHGLCWKDIEAIHTHLQFLERLYLGAFCRTPSLNDFLGLPRLIPAKTLKNLEVLDYQISPWFIYYCAWKYPNLETLELYETFPVRPHYINHAMGLSQLQSNPAFQKLTTIKLGTNRGSRALHETLQRIIAQSARSIAHLEYSDILQGALDPYYQATNDPLLQVFEKSAESLKLHLPDSRNSSPRAIFQSVSKWPCLTQLDINAPYLNLDIHHILGCCLALKRLVLTFRTLEYIFCLSKPQQTYELESLTLQNGTFHSDLLYFISKRCRRLNELKLIRLIIDSRVDSICFPLGIDMRYTTLNNLVLDKILFDGVDGFGSRYDVQNNVMLVYQMRSTFDDDTTSATYNHMPTQTEKMQWFHWHRAPHAPPPLGQCRKLNEKEASFTKSVFRTYQYRYVYSVDQDKRSHRTRSYRDREDWQNDLYKGHTTFICESVLNLVIRD